MGVERVEFLLVKLIFCDWLLLGLQDKISS